VMVDVTAALETRRSAAIAGSEGRKMLVDRMLVAANAQMTALQAVAVRSRGGAAGVLLRTTSMFMACVSRAGFKARRIACAATALGPDGCILSNRLRGVVLGMTEVMLCQQG
jgi:hypothetical protein